MSKFTSPDDASIYTTHIFERSFDLIRFGIWEGIDIVRLEQWISNFETELERYFAACILDNFIYRSDHQTYSLIYQIFSRCLPDLFRLRVYYNFDESCLTRLQFHPTFGIDPLVRLVLAVKKTDPPTKSAHRIARFFKRKFDVVENWIIKPSEIEKCSLEGVKYFIFIDDFVGTGHQFTEICDEHNINKYDKAYFLYVPLIAHEMGLDYINQNYPNISISPAEFLAKDCSMFDSSSKFFKDNINTPDLAREFYYEMLEKYNISKKVRRGYGNLELALAFQHAAPDNSLKIIWHDDNNWNSLVDR